MTDFFLDSLAFGFACVALPVLLSFGLALRLFNIVVLKCLSFVYPELEFVTYTNPRILLDTHRNQGVINVLLAVKGEAQLEFVRRHLQELIKRKNKCGRSVFPRLKQTLVARYGHYAWHSGNFDINQHVVVAPSMYRGRNISETNIQEYVSHVVSKYLPPGVPPWQLTMIPTTENQHYILLKLHHILLCEGLNIADLLPLTPPIRQTISSNKHSPILDAYKPPRYIPLLHEQLTEEFSNRWNEFVASYDPLEYPEILKNGPGFYQFLAIMAIAFVATVRECRRDFVNVKPDALSKLNFVLVTLRRETSKRQVTFGGFLLSVLRTVDPRNVLGTFVRYVWYFTVCLLLKWPILVYYELASLYGCLTLQYCPYSNTLIGTLYRYVPLFYNSVKETVSCLGLMVKAPRRLFEEVLLEEKVLLNVTLCGRKVVAWSQPVKTEYIRTIADKANLTELEVTLAAVSASVSRYLTNSHRQEIIYELPILVANMNSNHIFATGNNVKPSDSISGLLCFKLPVLKSEKQISVINNADKIRRNLEKSLNTQTALYLLSLLEIRTGLLSKWLPPTFLTVVLKYICGKFTVSFTEITTRHPNITQRTLWGQEVTSAIFWRPPQATLSISLCLNEYADHVRLGVMCDALMGPNHPDFVKVFPEQVKALASAYGVE